MSVKCCNCDEEKEENKMLYDKRNNEYLCKVCFVESLVKRQKNNVIYGYAVDKNINLAYTAAGRVFDEKLKKNLKER